MSVDRNIWNLFCDLWSTLFKEKSDLLKTVFDNNTFITQEVFRGYSETQKTEYIVALSHDKANAFFWDLWFKGSQKGKTEVYKTYWKHGGMILWSESLKVAARLPNSFHPIMDESLRAESETRILTEIEDMIKKLESQCRTSGFLYTMSPFASGSKMISSPKSLIYTASVLSKGLPDCDSLMANSTNLSNMKPFYEKMKASELRILARNGFKKIICLESNLLIT
jgi:hypothetical protein